MISLKINPEDVDKFVKDAFLQSAIGTQITDAINKALKEAMTGYSSPVAKMVHEEIKSKIKEFLETDAHKQKMKELIAQHFGNEIISRVLEKSVEQAIRYLKTDY